MSFLQTQKETSMSLSLVQGQLCAQQGLEAVRETVYVRWLGGDVLEFGSGAGEHVIHSLA